MPKNLEHEKRIAEKQQELAKSWRLPKLEAGYHYQGILGQRFSAHAGVTLPVWEQKFRTQQEQAKLAFSELNLQSRLNDLRQYNEETLENIKTIISQKCFLNVEHRKAKHYPQKLQQKIPPTHLPILTPQMQNLYPTTS